MNFEDLDVGSLRNQKIPLPIIESIVLNDQGGSISLDISWSFYAPLVGTKKDIFSSYKELLTTRVTLFTFDTTDYLNFFQKEGLYYKETGTIYNFMKTFGVPDKMALWTSTPEPLDNKSAIVTSFADAGGESIRKFSFNKKFVDLPATEYTTDKEGFAVFHTIAKDRIVNLMGVIEITADFGAGNLPFPVNAETKTTGDTTTNSSVLNYAFPFTIASNGVVDFNFTALQTNNAEIWAGPFAYETDKKFEQWSGTTSRNGDHFGMVGSTTTDLEGVEAHSHAYDVNDYGNGEALWGEDQHYHPITNYKVGVVDPKHLPSHTHELTKGHKHSYKIDTDGNGETGVYERTEKGKILSHKHEIKNGVVQKGGPTPELMHVHTINLDEKIQIIEEITKLPVDENDPDLKLVTISDPTIVSDFISVGSSDFMDLDFNKGEFSTTKFTSEGPKSVTAKTLTEAIKSATIDPTKYFTNQKLEKIESPVSQMFFWDDTEPSTMNLAFLFSITKFINSSAFKYQNTSLGNYEDSIKSMSLLRRKVAKNIQEKFTEDFLEEEVFSIKHDTLKEFLTRNQTTRYLQNAALKNTAILNSYNCSTDNEQKMLFSVKDKEINKKYNYQYRLKIVYDSKLVAKLRPLVRNASAAYNEFSNLDNIIALSRFYDVVTGKMTKEFVTEFGDPATHIVKVWDEKVGWWVEIEQPKGALPRISQAFTDLYKAMYPVISDPEAQQKFDDAMNNIEGLLTVNWKTKTTKLLPSTYLVLKKALGDSLTQIKNFTIGPSLTIKPKQADSKAPAAPIKYYSFPNTVGFSGDECDLFLEYFDSYKTMDPIQTKGDGPLYLDVQTIAEAFVNEYVKYIGRQASGPMGKADTLSAGFDFVSFADGFATKTFTPTKAMSQGTYIGFLSSIGTLNITEENLTQFILNVQMDKKTELSELTKDTPLLQSLVADGLSIIDSTNEADFTVKQNKPAYSFDSFFGGANSPFNPKQKPLKNQNSSGQYQELQPLTTVHSFSELVGTQTLKKQIQILENLPLDVGQRLPPSDILKQPVPYVALAEPYAQNFVDATSPNDFRTVYGKIRNKVDLTIPETLIMVLLLTNVVFIEVLVNGVWESYDAATQKGINEPNSLARLSFYQNNIVRNILLGNTRINNRYFVLQNKK